MDTAARLDTVDAAADVVAVAQRHLAADPRVMFHLMDGAAYLAQQPLRSFDLIYADTWPGKFTDLDRALDLRVALGPKELVPNDAAPNVGPSERPKGAGRRTP